MNEIACHRVGSRGTNCRRSTSMHAGAEERPWLVHQGIAQEPRQRGDLKGDLLALPGCVGGKCVKLRAQRLPLLIEVGADFSRVAFAQIPIDLRMRAILIFSRVSIGLILSKCTTPRCAKPRGKP